MSSLQSALVYKYTITFTAEPAGLPWVRLEKPDGSRLPPLCWTSPSSTAPLLQIHLPALHLDLPVPGRHKPIFQCSPWRCLIRDAPLEMPHWRCSGNIFPTQFMWILGAVPFHCWVWSCSRCQSPVGALEQPKHIQRPTGSSSCQQIYHDDSPSKDLKSLALLIAIHSYPSKKSHFI